VPHKIKWSFGWTNFYICFQHLHHNHILIIKFANCTCIQSTTRQDTKSCWPDLLWVYILTEEPKQNPGVSHNHSPWFQFLTWKSHTAELIPPPVKAKSSHVSIPPFLYTHPATFKELSHRKLMFMLLCCISCLHCSVKQPFLWLNLYSKPIPTKRCSQTYTQTDVLSTLNTAESVFIQHPMWHGYSKIMNAVQGLEEGVGCSLYCGWE